jgi:hypothetical protein
MENEDLKICTKCKKGLTLDKFRIENKNEIELDNTKPKKYRGECIECEKNYSSEYRKKIKELKNKLKNTDENIVLNNDDLNNEPKEIDKLIPQLNRNQFKGSSHSIINDNTDNSYVIDRVNKKISNKLSLYCKSKSLSKSKLLSVIIENALEKLENDDSFRTDIINKYLEG